jgi:hypothetical protein
MSDTFIYSGNSVPPGGTVGQVLTKVGGPNYYTAWRTLEVATGDGQPGDPQNIALSGDISGTGTTSILTTLTSTGVTAGTYNNSATSVRPFTVDIKGRITAIGSAVTVTPAFGSITSKPTSLAGYGITDAPTTTGTGASGTWGINVTGSSASCSGNATTATTASNVAATADQAIVNQQNGNTSAWFGRILSKNATSDRAAFLGTYAGIAGVFSHNNALNAWADLYVNTVDGSSGGSVRLPSTVFINGNQALHTGNYTSYSPSLTGTGASGTWGINITGSAGSVAAANVSGLGTIATQNSDNVSITGGSIDGLTYDDGTY